MSGHIVITGPMGVGKTTTATALADSLGLTHRDSDVEIEARTGRTGRQIAETEGVAFLHALEAEVLLDALDSAGASVVSAAGSVVDHHGCRAALKDGPMVVVLQLDLDDLLERMVTGSHRREVDEAEVKELLDRRAVSFAEVADIVLDATEPTSQLVSGIVAALEDSSNESPWS